MHWNGKGATQALRTMVIRSIWAVCLIALVFVTTSCGESSGEREIARKFSSAANQTGRINCTPRYNSKVIVCIIHTTPRDADIIARGMIHMAHARDIELHGWKLTLTTLDDYVVTLRF